MTTNFYITLRSVLILIKFIGLINFSYTTEEPTRLLVRNPNPLFYLFLELIRILALFKLTHTYLNSPLQTILRQFYLLSFWKTMIAARISETWIIKFINGIIEFDRKITPLLSRLSTQPRSMSKTYWNIFLFLLFTYFIVIKFIFMYVWPPRTQDIYLLSCHIFGPPFPQHFIVLISTCFFLYSFYIRFGTLNDLWERLPVGLIAVHDQRTHIEIAVLIDDIRLLHSELSDILKIFSLGYGPLLIVFFASNFIYMIFNFFFAFSFSYFSPQFSYTENVLRILMMYLTIGQSVFFVMFIVVLVSFINDQIKMFMNQVSVYESDEITAFGLFKINLNLVISILELLITGVATSIQMKEHPMVLKWINEVQSIAALQFKIDNKLTTDSSVQ